MRWSEDVREKAADLFELGLGYKAVSEKLGVKRSAVREWAYAYRALGREGLRTKGRRREYSPDVKLAAARARVDEGLTAASVMERYGVGNRRQIKEWSALYREKGDKAFGQELA